MRIRTPLAVLASSALLLGACTSAPEPATSTSPAPVESSSESGEVAGAGVNAADVEAWKAGPVPASGESGPVVPTVWPAAVVKGSGTSTSLTPTLVAPGVTGKVDVQVVSLTDGGGFGADGAQEATGVVFEGRGDAEGTEIPAESLQPGATYAWRVSKDGQAWEGPWAFNVDTVRAQSAPTDSMGGIVVNMLSGVPSFAYESPTVAGALGGVSIGLFHRPDLPAVPGLPAGWAWALPGTSALELTTSSDAADPASVTLQFGNGVASTFVRTESGAYVPGLADGTITRYSAGGQLVAIEPGVWQYTASDGSVSRYVDGRPVAEWSGGKPVAVMTWDSSGRLTSVGDGVSRTASLSYAGGGSCPADSWGNSFEVVEGLWCSITNADGSVTAVGYVGKQIGLIADAGGVSVGFGWDAAGRISALRSMDAGAAAATAGGDWAGADLATQVAYDKFGRVASLTSGAASPGGERVTRSYTYPTDTSGDTLAASASQVSGETDNGTVVSVVATSDTWQVISREDVSGRTSKAVYDEATGALVGGTDNTGRTFTMKVDATTKVTSSIGPYQGSSDGAMRTDRVMDATAVDPSRGADSPVERWQGLQATVWAKDAVTPEWWNGDVLRGGLAARLDYPGQWNAQATGTWTTDEGGEWLVTVKSSDNVAVDVTIDGARCTDAEGKDGCTIKLDKGPHAIALALEGESTGSFEIRAGRGKAGEIPLEALTPNYGAATVMEVNDNVGQRNLGTQLLAVSRPWAGSPDTVTTSGSLTTAMAYEPNEPTAAQWGRMVSKTTPGGSVQSVTYYGDSEDATDPCTQQSYPQAGLPKTTTRYDGVTVTTVYNASGLPVSTTTQGSDGGELACTAYDVAGRAVSTSLSTLDGKQLNAATATYVWQDGLLTETATAQEGDQSFTMVTVTNVLGQLVSYTDAWGNRTDYAYSAQGNLLERRTTPQGADSPLLTVAYAYDSDGRLDAVAANGKELAKVSYAQDELVSKIAYAGGVVRDYAYDSAGAVRAFELSTTGRSYTLTADRNPAGRVLGTRLNVSDKDRDITDAAWSYAYDEAGRLVVAKLTTEGDSAAMGDKKREFTYAYNSPEACPSKAGDNFDRTGGSRDGVDFVTCYDDKGRLSTTTDPQLAPEGDKAKATWDGLGRLVALDAQTPLAIEWAGATQVASVTQGESVTSFLRVGTQLIEQTIEGTATRFGYAAASNSAPTLVLDASGTVTSMRLGLPGGAEATLTPQGDPSTMSHLDLFSGWLTTTGADGTAQGAGESALAAQYGPYGEPLVTTQTAAPPMSYGWQAGARNIAIGGAHDLTFSARPYHPWLGQFLAFDPVPGASATGYGYGDADPVNKPDYSGNFGVWEWLGVAGGVVAAIGGLSSGKVAGSTSAIAWGASVGAMAVGSIAAATGIVGTWVTGEETSSSVISTAVAALGIALSVRGAWNWDTNSFQKRLRLYGVIAEQDLDAYVAEEIQRKQGLLKQIEKLAASKGNHWDKVAAEQNLRNQVHMINLDINFFKENSRAAFTAQAAARNGDEKWVAAFAKVMSAMRSGSP
jgi:large repetitive protein